MTTSIFEKYDLIEVDESFPIPKLPPEGLILIYGTSGSGKSTILRSVFGNATVEFNSEPIYKNFSTEENAELLLIACGLRTVPAWRRPYSQLSTGEQHRAYCAKSLDLKLEYLDEFTSVVDRNTAKSLSYAIQKHFRRTGMKRLVIASCHNDIIPWLNPDHVYNTDLKIWEDLELPRGQLWRPSIELEIRAVEGQIFWKFFKKHHYLNSRLNKPANCFIALYEGMPVAFTSIITFPNGNFKNAWRAHRTVVLPEFQGLGIGSALSDTIAQLVIDSGGRFFSKTSHPALGLHREKSSKWVATSKNLKNRGDYKVYEDRTYKEDKYKMQHVKRLCYSHEYVGERRVD